MLNNISFLALFVFLTPCFASDPTKIHSAFSHLVRPFAIYAQCGLNLFFFRQNNDVCWRKEKYLLFSTVNVSIYGCSMLSFSSSVATEVTVTAVSAGTTDGVVAGILSLWVAVSVAMLSVATFSF